MIDMDTRLRVDRGIAKTETAAAQDAYYNLIRPHKALRLEVNDASRRWQQRTPAMAAGLTDHIWTVKELFLKIPAPLVNNT